MVVVCPSSSPREATTETFRDLGKDFHRKGDRGTLPRDGRTAC